MSDTAKPEPVVELKAFLADQVKAAEVGRNIYCEDRVSAGLRYDALNASLRHAEIVFANPDDVIKTAKKFEKYLRGTDL